MDEFHDHKPTECRGCGKRLHGADAAPLRHQVTEIPPITPHVSEHRLHALRCSCCDEVTRAVLPQGISRGAFGTRLQSVASVLSGAYRLSKRNVESLLADLFGVELSLGSIKALEDQTSAALAAPVEEAQRWVKEHPCAQLDETGWRHQNKRSWLWTAVAGPVASFLIRSSRAGKIAKELVGECFGGVVCSDRWSATTGSTFYTGKSVGRISKETFARSPRWAASRKPSEKPLKPKPRNCSNTGIGFEMAP